MSRALAKCVTRSRSMPFIYQTYCITNYLFQQLSQTATFDILMICQRERISRKRKNAHESTDSEVVWTQPVAVRCSSAENLSVDES